MMALLKMEIIMDMPCSLNKMGTSLINYGKTVTFKNRGDELLYIMHEKKFKTILNIKF
jgi:hypothetical protein